MEIHLENWPEEGMHRGQELGLLYYEEADEFSRAEIERDIGRFFIEQCRRWEEATVDNNQGELFE